MHYRFFILLLVFGLACKHSKPTARPAQRQPSSHAPAKPKAPATTTTGSSTPGPASDASGAVDIPVKSDAEHVAWLDSERLMPVLEKAQRENKAVFIEFSASWCAPCRMMEEEVFSRKDVYQYLNKNFLNFKADCDTEAGKAISEIHEVKGLPTVIIVNPKGVVLERHLGFANPSVIFDMGDSALEQM